MAKSEMFAIHNVPSITQLEDGRTHVRNLDMPLYYLHNTDTVNSEGVIICESNERDYIGNFYMKIRKVKDIDLEEFLDLHYSVSTNKTRFLKLVKSISITGLSNFPSKRHFVLEWLEGKKQSPIINNIEPNYFLPLATLRTIHKTFNGRLWEPIDLNSYYSLFDFNNPIRIDFVVKKKSDFYALLWKMKDAASDEFTHDGHIKPFLEKYGCKIGSFANIKTGIIDSKRANHKMLIREIDEAMR